MREAIYQQQVKRLSVLPANIIGQAMVPMFSASVEPGWIPILDGRVFIGLWQMDGKVFTCLLPDSTDEVILSSMGEHSKSKIFPGVKLGYACLPLEIRGQHVVFKKNRKGNAGHAEASTDGIGAFWSLAKQFFSQHRTIPVRLFPLYLKEMEWRYNHRTENLVILLRNLLRQLTIDDLRDSSGLCTDENLNYSARAARSYSADKDPGSAPMLYH